MRSALGPGLSEANRLRACFDTQLRAVDAPRRRMHVTPRPTKAKIRIGMG